MTLSSNLREMLNSCGPVLGVEIPTPVANRRDQANNVINKAREMPTQCRNLAPGPAHQERVGSPTRAGHCGQSSIACRRVEVEPRPLSNCLR